MANRRAVILHGQVPPDAPPDELDVLRQVAAVSDALRGLGWDVRELPLDLDLAQAAERLRALAPAFVFNLVESIDGRGSFLHLAPALLEGLGVPFTGAGQEAMFLTSRKVRAKQVLSRAGISTPAWASAEEALAQEPIFAPPWIVKNGWEHASIGLEESSVVCEAKALRAVIRNRMRREGLGNLYVERYVEGRELNLALLARAGGDGPESLPPAEIDFIDYPEGKPRVVGYRAKWEEGTEEFRRTPRRFDFPTQDGPLLAELLSLSRQCWELFSLRGWARVDFRVDGAGAPWVLEVNANPCISPDAGFMAAAARAGLDLREVVARIVEEAIRGGSAVHGSAPRGRPWPGGEST